MKRNSVNMITAACFTILLGLTGCGGGGGASSDEISASYKGKTTQADVNKDNAAALSVDAIDIAQGSSDISGTLEKTVPRHGNAVSTLEFTKVVETMIEQSVAGKFVGKTVASIIEREVIGSGGGTANISISRIDPIKSTVSGSVKFNSYKDGDDSPAITGTVLFDGTVTINTSGSIDSIKRVDMSLNNVSAASDTESVTLFGTISIYNDAEKITLNLVVTDNATGTTRWMKDFVFTLLTETTMAVAGTYYDHAHGWVTVSTLTPLAVSDYGDTPTSGQLLFTGSKGSNARLTYDSKYSDGYMLEVDETGSGNYSPVQKTPTPV